MKLKTDPQTGVTTYTLSVQERKTLAAGKTVLQEMAYHSEDAPTGLALQETADMLGTILAPQSEEPKPEAPAD